MDKTFLYRIRVLGIIAVLIIAAHFYNGISLGVTTFIDGFKSGLSEQKGEIAKGESLDSNNIFGDIVLKPEKSITSSGKNKGFIDVEDVRMLLKTVDIKVNHTPEVSISIQATQFVISFTFLGLLIWLFVKVWGVIGPIGRGELMDAKTFVSLRTIGAMLIVIELLSILYSYLEVLHLRSFVKIEGYTIGVDYSLGTLLFGIILILLGEVLAYSARIKAEQELTI